MVEQYEQVIRDVIAGPQPEDVAVNFPWAPVPERVEDATSEITAFIISTGAPSFDECLRRLEQQTYYPKIEVIRDYTPMWRAFQEMHSRVQTSFFVQVDEDMLLQPWAIEELYALIGLAGEKCGEAVGWLWGDAESMPIQGVKIYRTEVAKQFPYSDSLSCEWPQYKAMQEKGYHLESQPRPTDPKDCYGMHYSLQTADMAFSRWKRLTEKWRAAPGTMGWVGGHIKKMKQRLLDRPSRMNLAVWNGIMAGLAGPMPEDTEMDAGQLDPTLRRLNWLLGKAADGPQELALYMTSKCNQKCFWCRVTCDPPAEAPPDVTPQLVEKVLRRFPTLKTACLAGFGEPLLNTDTPEVCKMLRDKGLSVSLITNGVLLKKRARQLAEAGLGQVTVSLNASTATEHERTTGTKTWQVVLDGITAAKVEDLEVLLSMVCHKGNTRSMNRFMSLADSLGCDIHFHNLLHHGDEDIFIWGVIHHKHGPALHDIEDAKQSRHAKRVRTWPVVLEGENPRLCQSPFVFVGVDGNGHVTPCRRILPPGPHFGAIHQTTWISEEFSLYRGAMLGDHPLPEACKFCFGAWSQ
jgi:MoaA/NifB/PqqE/SkfB family radical SAM enzyme